MKAAELDRLVMESEYRDVGRINARNDKRVQDLIAEGIAPDEAYGEMIRRDFAAVVARTAKLWTAPSKAA